MALICVAVASTYSSTVACEGKLSAAIVQFITLCHELGILTYNHQQLCACILCGKEMNMYDALDYHGCSSLFEDNFEVHLLSPLQRFCVYMMESGEISYNRELIACRNCSSYESPLQFIVHCCRKSDAVLEGVHEDVKAHPNRNDNVFAPKDVHRTNFGLVEGRFAENNEKIDAEFRAAVLGNDFMKIRSILDKEQLYNPPTDSIITATSLGHYDSVVELITCTRIRSPIYEFNAFLKAIENSDTNPYCFRIMSMMMQDEQFDPSMYKNDALILSSKLGRVQCLNEMLMDDRIDCGDQDQKAIISASEGGHYEVVQTLLEQDKVDATARDNEAFILACEMGHFKIVELLLNNVPRLDASCRDNEGLILACRNGHTETVRVLLQEDSVDPSARNDEPLIQAIKIGNDEIVFMLLDSTRKPRHRIMRKPLPSIISKPRTVDPSCRSNWPILIASKLGHFSIVSRLLEDKRTDPSVENNAALLTAIAGNHLKVVQLLLSAPKVNPADQNNKSIIVACYYGHYEIVKLLLQDSRVDPTANNNDCFIFAIKNGHLKTVENLLDDSRFQVRPRIEEARLLADNHGHKEISDLLRPKEITN